MPTSSTPAGGRRMSAHSSLRSRPGQTGRVAGEAVAHSSAFEWLARGGFLARGAIYGIIGILSIKLAAGSGGTTANQQGALEMIAHQPFGKVLLVLAAVGLAGYSLWRLTRALLGHTSEDSNTRFERVAALGSGIVYGILCVVAIEILLGSRGDASSSGNTHKTTAGVLGWFAGVWIVGIAGAVLIGIGLFQAYRGATTDFLKDSKTEVMGPRVRLWIVFIGTFGHLARAAVVGLVGVLMVKAAIDYNPDKAVGLDGALAKLANQSYGSFLLGIVAAGLIAFALYSISDARYRRI